MWITIYTNIIAGIFMLLFIYTASSKLFEYHHTELQMSKSPIITEYAHILVWIIPSLEIIVSILIVIPKTLMLGLYCTFGLMSAFTAYIYAILNYSDNIPCSCGGIISSLSWNQHLILNLILIFLDLIAILIQPARNEGINSDSI